MHQILDQLEKKRHVIWDWNGTLLDDVDLAVAAIGEVLKAQGLPPIARDTYLQTFCFPISKYYQQLGIGEKGEAFEAATLKFVASYRQLLPACQLHVGAVEVLQAIQGRQVKQSILSAAHESDLHHLLGHFGIAAYFDHIFGLNNHYAASKVDRGRQLLDICGASAKDSVLIGDTDHDWEVGRALGVDVILFADGHQHESRLTGLAAKIISKRRS